MKSNLLEDFSFTRAIMLGLLLGLTTFWNGSMLLGSLMLLGGVFLFSSKRVELILIAIISLAICLLLTRFFVGDQASVKPEFWMGMLAYPKNPKTIVKYYLLLFGLMPFIYLSSILISNKKLKLFLLLFIIPFLFANTVKITPDINANHKFIIVTQIGTALGCGLVIYSLFNFKNMFFKMLACVLFFTLSSTGAYDYYTFYHLNKNKIRHPEKDKMKSWVMENTHPKDTFLTPMISIHPILLAGRSVYFGWPYFAWSAGYPTEIRMPIYEHIYEAKTQEELMYLLKDTSIDYILFDASHMREEKWKKGIYRTILNIAYQDQSDRILYTVPKHWSH